MPEISRFYGIVIAMYYYEHGVAHFHATHGEHKVSVEVDSGTVRGIFPTRPLRRVLHWRALHKAELLTNWNLARDAKPLNPIPPLE